MKFKFSRKIYVIQEKFLVFLKLIRGPDITHSGGRIGQLAAGCAPLHYKLH